MSSLTPSEWITIAAIVVGPIVAVLTQLGFQARKAKRDQKLWVFGQLMSKRATFVHPDFITAFNFVDVVFHKQKDIRAKHKEMIDVIYAGQGENGALTNEQVEHLRDLLAEMLAKMGAELGYKFGHTEIKNTAYYPQGQGRLDAAALALREKGLAVLEGKANIGVVIRNDERATGPR